MQTRKVNDPWIDDEFFEQGSFLVTDKSQSVVLLKGGIISSDSRSPFKKGLSIFCKNFYDNVYLFHHSEQFINFNLVDLQKKILNDQIITPVRKKTDYDHIFEQDFLDLKKKIPSEVKKAVLVSREEYQISNPLQLKKHLFAKALEMNQGRAYGFWNKDFGIIGSTPETLFRIENGLIATEALAGTAKAGQEAELMNSKKDRNEHEYVIKDISEKLFDLGLVAKVESTTTSGFSSIIHLRTKLVAKPLNHLSAIHLSQALSPTAALGGYPKEKAKDYLLNTRYQKLFQNRIFGSVIGTDNDGPLGLVMIRNIQWIGETFFIESGVGVVEESNLMQEMQEIKLKREIVRNYYL